MLVILGYLVVIFSVFGGFLLSGGSLYALFQPFEFLIIMGAAVGIFIIGNNKKVIKATLRAVFSVFKSGSDHSKKFYLELLMMYFELTNKIRKDGVMSIEADIEDYKKSPLFGKYKLLVKEPKLMEFICDHLRLIVTGRVNVEQLENLMDEDIEAFQHEGELPILALTKVADALPAFGIVAAVMGVVITMQMVGGSPKILGEHIARALVGTFLGVLISYGFTAPLAAILENRLHADSTILQSVKVLLLASVHNLAPIIAVEFARKVLYAAERPSNREMETMLKEMRTGKSKEQPETPDTKAKK